MAFTLNLAFFCSNAFLTLTRYCNEKKIGRSRFEISRNRVSGNMSILLQFILKKLFELVRTHTFLFYCNTKSLFDFMNIIATGFTKLAFYLLYLRFQEFVIKFYICFTFDSKGSQFLYDSI